MIDRLALFLTQVRTPVEIMILLSYMSNWHMSFGFLGSMTSSFPSNSEGGQVGCPQLSFSVGEMSSSFPAFNMSQMHASCVACSVSLYA